MTASHRQGPQVLDGRWALVSAGEYDRRAHRVTVNMAVVDAVHARFGDAPAAVRAAIVAHERVHAAAAAGPFAREEEALARAAAVEAAGACVVAHIDAVLAGAWT